MSVFLVLVSQKSKKKKVSNGTSILDQAMNMNSNNTNDLILEPGQEAPTQSTNTNNSSTSFGDDIMSRFTETFTKRSTQFTSISTSASSSTYRKGINVDDYFGNKNNIKENNAISHQERIKLNQKKALEKLKKNGGIGNIGREIKKPINKQKKIKRRAITSSYNNNPSSFDDQPLKQTPMQPKPKPINNGLNDDMDDLNANGDIDMIDSSNNTTNDPSTNSTSMNDSGLNSALGDSLASFGEDQEADATALRIQQFEQAKKAALDQTAAYDEEEHLENCNVYVGGLHPEVDQAMLRKFFQHCGDIRQIRLDWRKKGFGFIHYSTHEQAREAIEDMDGRIIMGQPIKCRWAKNKNKEKERELRLREEQEKELAKQNGILVPDDPNEELNKDVEVVTDVIDSINTNHNLYHSRPGGGNNNKNNMSNKNEGSTTSIGFLSRGMGSGRKSNKSMGGPPPLTKMKDDNKKDDGIEDNNDEVEYW